MSDQPATFVAKYGSKCGAGDTIVPGQECRYVGVYAYHLDCVPETMIDDDGKRQPFQGTAVEDMGY